MGGIDRRECPHLAKSLDARVGIEGLCSSSGIESKYENCIWNRLVA